MSHGHCNNIFRILSECSDGYIGVCTACGEFNFGFKNVLLCFRHDELHGFFRWVIDYRQPEVEGTELPNGRTQLYQTPLGNLFLAYNEEELDCIIGLYQQAKIVLEADSIINPHNHFC